MALNDLFRKTKEDKKEDETSETEVNESIKQWIGTEIEGKIIKIESEKGWGFISSVNVPFTRIFFHWTGLIQDTLHFSELTKGMKLKFVLTYKEGKGFTAVRIKVHESELEPIDGD